MKNFFALPTGIGSLPYKEAEITCQKILQYFPQIPHWPQLPRLSFRENMYAQFSEGFPGIILDEKEEKIYLEENKFNHELETFYQNYLTGNIDYFAISPAFAAGLHAFSSFLSTQLPPTPHSPPPIAVKGQITGPLTMGLAIKDENGRSIFYNEQMRDALVKFLQMKALWQLSQLSTISAKGGSASGGNYQLSTILFIDEPYLAAYGSAFTAVSRDEIIQSLTELISGIKDSLSTYQLINLSTVLIGIHCCANTDWSLVLGTDIDILSFDAYDFFDSLLLYREEIKTFLEGGGILAWGSVPTDEKVLSEDVHTLKDKFFNSVQALEKSGIERKKLLTNFLLTPSCGLGTRSEELAERVLLLTSELSRTLQETIR